MKWKRGPASGDVEDRRGQRISGATAAKAGGGAAVIAVIVAILSQVLGGSSGGGGAGGGGAGGIDLSGLGAAISGATQGGGGGASSGGATAPIDPATDPDAELVAYIDFVMKDIQDTFATKVKGFERAKLVIFTDAVETGGCGSASSAVGPFYCPGDSKAYIDLSFYRDLKARFGAPGDFAQAYVLAHEIGHHLQNLLGANEQGGARHPGRQVTRERPVGAARAAGRLLRRRVGQLGPAPRPARGRRRGGGHHRRQRDRRRSAAEAGRRPREPGDLDPRLVGPAGEVVQHRHEERPARELRHVLDRQTIAGRALNNARARPM
jgi:predicted metalloprotease